jgi:LysR family glycine cleavage system transcriptional activator
MSAKPPRPKIDRRWLPLNALRAFEAVAQRLNFTAGAQALGVSQSAISRHIISLEGLLGEPLFERRPQGLALTPAGAALLPVVAKSFDRMEQSLNAIVTEGGGQRTLRVHLPPSFAQELAVPLLRDLKREHPGLALDIASPGTVGAPPQDVDAAVVFARPQFAMTGGAHVSDLLWMAQVTPMCHPAVAARARAAASPEAFLAGADLLHVKLERQPRFLLWEAFARQTGLRLETARGLAFDTASLAAQYALSGEGVALLDTRLFAREIAAGRLVAPFPLAAEDGYGYFLNVHPEDLADPGVAAFRDWIVRRFSAAESPLPQAEGVSKLPHRRIA